MAYNKKYLVKVGSYEVPLKFIQYNSYVAEWATNDLDSFRNAEGELVRNALARKTMKVEWNIPPMYDSEVEEFLSNLRSQLSSKENSAMVEAFIPYEGTYKTDKCYLTSNVNIQIRAIYNNRVEYEPIRIALIGYSTSSAL